MRQYYNIETETTHYQTVVKHYIAAIALVFHNSGYRRLH